MLFNVPRAKIIAWLSRYGDTATLDGMFELPMTTARYSEIPTIRFQHCQEFIYFHVARIAESYCVTKDA